MRSASPIFLINFILIISPSFSQSIIRSTTGAGGSSEIIATKGHSYFVSQSIGQASVIGTSSSSGFILRQGFQQPFDLFEIKASAGQNDLKAIVYPNPFDQSVHISFLDGISEEVSLIVHDISGRMILNEIRQASQLITINLKNIAAGDYILNVAAGEKYMTTSIIKK